MKKIGKFAAALVVMAAAIGMMGCSPSVEGGNEVKQTVATPTFSVAAGAVDSGTTVTLSCATTGAVIHYTTNGDTPTASSATYSTPINITTAQTIKAIAVKDGMNNSAIASAAYTINTPAPVQTVATPTFSVAAGAVDSGTTVTLSCATTGAVIHYTTNGDTPTASSATYSTPISITTAQTIKAIAVKDGMNNSAVASASYTINSPAGGTIPEGFVQITGATVTASVGEDGGPFYNATSSSVTVNTFYMAETELTYAKWYEVYTWATKPARGDNKYTFAGKGLEGKDGVDGTIPTLFNTEPVTRVSWRDAVVWCNAASEKEGLTPVYYLEGTTDFTDSTKVLRYAEDYNNWGTVENGTHVAAGSGKAEKAVINTSANGYRLPTEAEWEYAARGGNPANITVWNYTYAGTSTESELGNYAVYSANSNKDTANVKSKGEAGKNAAGLWDMSGNVCEWCQDTYSSSSSNRVCRGGSWANDASGCTVVRRYGITPCLYSSGAGFRVVRSAQ